MSALLAAASVLPGCGDDAPPAAPPASPAKERPLPTVVQPTPAEKVQFAFERLTRGPGSLGGLVIKNVHRRNLELATADLQFYEPAASAFLANAETVARITGDPSRYGDGWHNVLRLLLAFKARPVDLVVAWTEPALDLPLTDDLISLRVESVRVLALTPAPETADLLLRFFADTPAEREVGQLAMSALVRQPTHRARALTIALREGPAVLWQDAPLRIAGATPEGEGDVEVAGALAWWHALTVGSGPRMDTTLPHLKSQPWTQARLGLDPAVPPQVVGANGRPRLRFGSLPANVVYGSGWFSTSLSTQAVLPAHAMVFTGKLPAAEVRCVLGRWKYNGYKAAVLADLELEAIDEGVYFAAKHCMLDVSAASDSMICLQVAETLDAPGPWDTTRIRRLQRLVSSIGGCGDAEVWRQLSRVLHEVRPLTTARPVLDLAYGLMRPREIELRALVRPMLLGDDAADFGVALHLIRGTLDPLYLDALEQALEKATAPQRRRLLRNTITFLYARAREIEPARHAAFVKSYGEWLAGESPQRFIAVATGLLDFGDAGAEAFAKGLRGPQRHLFIQAWPRDMRLVPLVVSTALVEPIDRTVRAVELNHLLGLAWSSFPEGAAPYLEALRLKLRDPAARSMATAALERVRHRAPRHSDNH